MKKSNKKGTKKASSPNNDVTNEDQQLWDHLASGLNPLKRLRLRVHPQLSAREQQSTDNDTAGPKKNSSGEMISSRKVRSSEDLAEQNNAPVKANKTVGKKTTVPALASFEKKAARRLNRGNTEIAARIDLHGLRQAEAHNALRRFLLSSYARGHRWVLVITGKGSTQRNREDADFGYTQERGVLRTNVPRWLAEPELRAVVVSYTTAAQHHGGAGALYVQLRNPNRAKKR